MLHIYTVLEADGDVLDLFRTSSSVFGSGVQETGGPSNVFVDAAAAAEGSSFALSDDDRDCEDVLQSDLDVSSEDNLGEQ